MRSHMATTNLYPLQLITDAHDLFAALQCDKPYRGADQSITLYLEALKEALAQGRIQEIRWVTTHDMLVDSMTKNMPDVLLNQLMQSGAWYPKGEKKLWSLLESWYVDSTENCVYNGCACMWYSAEPFCVWKLPVCMPAEDPGEDGGLSSEYNNYDFQQNAWLVTLENGCAE